ncbi:MAG: caspase family protein [Geminicoccaceae bacterium]
MRLLAAIILLVIGALGASGSASAAGIDRAYLKEDGGRVWGDVLSEFFRFRRFAKSYALVVGINDYTGGYRSLPTADDPTRMRDFLLNEAGFDYVHVLTNGKATARRVRELMVDVFPEMVGSKDRFLFYWSGHGDQRQNALGGQIGYLPLAASSPGQFSSMISMGDIRRWDELLNAHQVLFLLDACFSGLAGSTSQSELSELSIEQLMRSSHHLVTAGTGGEETIASDRWGGSIFTDSVLAAARGAADSSTADDVADGVVSLHELIDYVQRRVAREKNAAGWSGRITPQMRDLRGSNGQFFFLSNDHKIAERRDETTPADATWVFKGGVPYVEEPEPVAVASSPGPSGIDTQVWREIDGSQDEDKLEVFVETFPNSPWVPFAERQLERLREAGQAAAFVAKPAVAPEPAPMPSPEIEESAPSFGTPAPTFGMKALEAALGLSEELRKSLQWSLYQQGYYKGPIDGVLGKWSREAIAAWKVRLGLSPSSYLTTKEEVDRLLEAVEAARSRPAAAATDRSDDVDDPKPPRDGSGSDQLAAGDLREAPPATPDRSEMQARADTLLARWTPRRYPARETGWQDCNRRIALGPLRPSSSATLAGLGGVQPDAAVSVRGFRGFDVDAELMAVAEPGRSTVIEHKFLKDVRGWCSRQVYDPGHFSQLLRSSGLGIEPSGNLPTATAAGFVYAVVSPTSGNGDRHCLLFVTIQGKRRIDGYSCPEIDGAMTASEIERFLERIRI